GRSRRRSCARESENRSAARLVPVSVFRSDEWSGGHVGDLHGSPLRFTCRPQDGFRAPVRRELKIVEDWALDGCRWSQTAEPSASDVRLNTLMNRLAGQ